MEQQHLFLAERRLMELVWDNEPIGSTALCKLCEAALGWKKSTTYTMLRKLSERGVLVNENTVVRSCISRAEVAERESETLLARGFSGSLPLFVAAMLQDRKLTAAEADALKRLIEEATE